MANSSKIVLIVTLSLLLMAGIIFASGLGYIAIPSADIVHILFAQFGSSLPDHIDKTFPFVILEVRLPRIICSAIVGGGLAVAGCVFQSILKNPLADPYTLGISSGAAFGASLALLLGILGLYSFSAITLPLSAFAGSIATLFAVFYLTAPSVRLSSNSLILAGIIVSAILSAGISFIKFLADEQVNAIIFWIMGSFIGTSWANVLLLLLLVLPSVVFIFCHFRELDIMTFGERATESLGIDSKTVRKRLLIISSLIAAACVSVSGIIGFVGLIIPHFSRMLIGPSNILLIPCSFVCGCLLLLFADTITRVFLPTELPIGILTALIGGPVFCYIFRKIQLSRWRS